MVKPVRSVRNHKRLGALPLTAAAGLRHKSQSIADVRSFKLRYLGRQGCMPNVTRNAFQLAYEGGASVGFRTDAIDGGPGCGAEGKQEDACRRKEEVRDRGREQSV